MTEQNFIPDEWDLLEAKEQMNENEMVNAEAVKEPINEEYEKLWKIYEAGIPIPETQEEWLEIRKRGIGGSDVAGIMGINPWASPLTVYLDKVGVTGKKETNEKMEIGTELEPFLREKFRKKMSKELTDLKVITVKKILFHQEHNFILANVDGLVYCKEYGWGILELKTTSERNSSEWVDDVIPNNYMCQVQHYLFVTGLQYAYIACLIGGQKFVVKRILRDNELIDILFDKERFFWEEFVVKRIPPAPIGIESEEDAAKLAFPTADKTEISLPDELFNELEQYQSLKEEIKEKEKQIKAFEVKMKFIMGNASKATLCQYSITYPSISAYRFNDTELREKYPEIYKEFLKPSDYRRFEIKKAKIKKVKKVI